MHDEVMFGLQADSIARTGRGLNGDRLPLYFSEPGFAAGRDPLIIYLTAAVLRILPLSESAIRLSTALVGVLDVALVFLVAHRLFRSMTAALVSAFCLACAPAHLIHSRMALDFIYPLPFVLAWLWCLTDFLETERPVVLAAGMLALGFGVYSYLAALLTMPILFVFTCAALRAKRLRPGIYVIAATAFAVPLIPLLVWQILHPERYAQLLSAYRLLDTTSTQHLEGVKSLAGASSVSGRLETYWNFFNPGFLFFTGDSSLVNSTRLVGVLLTPMFVWLVVGVRRAIATRSTEATHILLWGLLAAPVGIVLMGTLEVRRALVFLPFAALLAGFGAEQLFQSRTRVMRAASVLLLLLAVVQFRGFLIDYFGPYRERSAFWFGGNLRGAFTDVIEREPAASPVPVYLSAAIPSALDQWTFYARAHGRDDLVTRGRIYGPDVLDAPSGAFLVSPAGSAATDLTAGSWSQARVIEEPNGLPAFVVLRKR
jgi:4-amino-4-deoxy-L-arabinose transferase-like glycosyltransferase